MTKSDLFKAAHKIARETKAIAGSYRIAFACALKDLYAGMSMTEKSTAEKLEELGIDVWECGDMKRYYINDENLEAVFGLEIDRYKSGNIFSARLNGEGISNNCAAKLIGMKIYFDAAKSAWMQKTAAGVKPINDTLAANLRI